MKKNAPQKCLARWLTMLAVHLCAPRHVTLSLSIYIFIWRPSLDLLMYAWRTFGSVCFERIKKGHVQCWAWWLRKVTKKGDWERWQRETPNATVAKPFHLHLKMETSMSTLFHCLSCKVRMHGSIVGSLFWEDLVSLHGRILSSMFWEDLVLPPKSKH